MRTPSLSARSVGLAAAGMLIGATLITPVLAQVGVADVTDEMRHFWRHYIKRQVTLLGDGRWASKTAEPWREVGATGQPAFITQQCIGSLTWQNYDSSVHNSAAFYKDPFGRVHLKGLVRDGSTFSHLDDGGFRCGKIFQLPEGYRTAAREVHATLTFSASPPGIESARVNVDADGTVWAAEGSNNVWLSLDGISFRAAN